MSNAHDLLMAQRAAMMGKSLPYDAEVEWIESVGYQYIDLGINGDALRNVRIEAKIQLSDYNSSNACGTWASEGRFQFGFALGNGLIIGIGDTSKDISGFIDYDFHEYVVDAFAKKAQFDGIEIVGFSTAKINFQESQRLYLFARNTYGGTAIFGRMKIKYAKVLFENTIHENLIPVRFTNERGVSEGAMYDRVSGQLFRNEGTGAFVIGPNKT